MRYYVIGRDAGGGWTEYIRDFDRMELTTDKYLALQISDADAAYLDMPYLNSLGFYLRDISMDGIGLLTALLFRPPYRRFRPRMMPPGRRFDRGPFHFRGTPRPAPPPLRPGRMPAPPRRSSPGGPSRPFGGPSRPFGGPGRPSRPSGGPGRPSGRSGGPSGRPGGGRSGPGGGRR